MQDRFEQLSVDRSARPVAILSPAIKTGASLLAALCVGTGLWATLAKIPVRVNGLAVMVSSEGILQVASPGSGRVSYPFRRSADGNSVTLEAPPWAATAYRLLYTAESLSNQQVEQLATDIVNSDLDDNARGLHQAGLAGGSGSGGAAVMVKRRQLLARIDNPALRAEIATNLSNLQLQEQNNTKLRQLLNENLRESSNYSSSKQAQLTRIKAAFNQGGLSETEFLTQAAEVQRSRQSISDLRTRIAEMERSIATQHKELYRALSTYLSRCLVFAKDDAELSQVLIHTGTEVLPGQVLMTLNRKQEARPDQIPLFLNQQSFAQIKPGMSTIATPVGFSSAEIGGINGTISELDPLPITASEIANRVGSSGIAQLVVQSGGLFQANMKLTREDLNHLSQLRSAYRSEYGSHSNRGGYQWNNRARPPIPPREGFLLATQITTRYRTPLEMLLPSIREVLGLNAPDKLIRQGLNQQ